MKNLKGILPLVVVIIIGIIAIGGVLVYQYYSQVPEEEVETATDETANWSVYRNEDFRFEIKYPLDWIEIEVLDEEILSGGIFSGSGEVLSVMFLSPEENSLKTRLQEHVTVGAKKLSSEVTLDEFSKGQIDYLKNIQGFEIIESEYIVFADLLVYKLVYTIKDNPSIINSKTLHIFVIKDDYSYTITYIADINRYSDFLGIADKMINSLKFF